MTYLETQQNETQAAKEEARKLRTRMKAFERYVHADKYCPIQCAHTVLTTIRAFLHV